MTECSVVKLFFKFFRNFTSIQFRFDAMHTTLHFLRYVLVSNVTHITMRAISFLSLEPNLQGYFGTTIWLMLRKEKALWCHQPLPRPHQYSPVCHSARQWKVSTLTQYVRECHALSYWEFGGHEDALLRMQLPVIRHRCKLSRVQ